MKTAEIDWEVLRKWEDRLDVAYRILEGQRKSGIWTLVCDEALRDLDLVRREIDSLVVDTVKETVR
jgi:TolB-like protein